MPRWEEEGVALSDASHPCGLEGDFMLVLLLLGMAGEYGAARGWEL